MEYVLNSKIIESEYKEKIKNAIILLHGYGGDGADISSIAYTWKRFIDNTIFLCPDGHEPCKLNSIIEKSGLSLFLNFSIYFS